MSHEYQLSPDALQDLDEAWLYIAADDVDAADRFVAKIIAACRLLADQPGLGHTREDLTDAPVRFWPLGSYLIVYSPGSRPLDVVGVFHGARNVPRFLSDRLPPPIE